MDRDALQDEVDEWVRDGIVSEAQADEILARYEGERSGRSRVVRALSIVGGGLVFAGVTLFFATNWHDLSRPVRAAVLVAAPTLAYAGGSVSYRREIPRVGLALCVLGALLVGPSVFLFEELFEFGLGTEWLLLVWTAVALPTGHALESRVATGFGLVVLTTLVVALAEPTDPAAPVGLLGVGLFALGVLLDDRSERRQVAWTYRFGGVAITLAVLFVLTTVEWRFARFEAEPSAILLATGVGSVLGVGWLLRTGRNTRAGWSMVGGLAVVGSVTVATLAPETIPELVAFAGLHLAMLAGLVATGALGYWTRSRALIDLAALGGLLQTLSFVAATVVDALSGSVALVVAGLILLAAGVVVERGRRSILSKFDRGER